MTPEEIRAVHAPNFQVKINQEIAAQICELNVNLQALIKEFVTQRTKKEPKDDLLRKLSEEQPKEQSKEQPKESKPVQERVERAVLK